MPGEKTYKVGSEVFDIPETEVSAFLKDNPDATEVQSFVVGKDTLDIPNPEVDSFLKDMPDARPLKKKAEATPSQSPSPLLSSVGASQSTAGASESSGNLDYFQGGNLPESEAAKQPIIDSVHDIQEKAPDLLRAATTPVITAKDQNNYDPALQEKIRGNQAEEALARGVVHLGNSILKTPAFLYDAAAAVTNKVVNEPLNAVTGGVVGYMPSSNDIAKNMPEDLKVTKQIDEALADSDKQFSKEYDKPIHEYLFGDKPDYKKGFEALGLKTLENAPTTLALMFGNAAGMNQVQTIGAGTAVFGADKMSEVEKSNPDTPLLNQVATSAGSGALEGIGESFGLTTIGKVAKNVFLKDGAEAAAKVAKDGFMKTYGKMMAKYIGVGAEEVTSEMATQYAQNLNDIYSGLNPKLDPMAGVADAGLLALGSSIGTAGSLSLLDVVKTKSAVKKAADIEATKNSLNEDLTSPDVSEESKPVIAKKILDLNEESADLAAKEKKAFDDLTPEGQQQVNDLVTQSKKLADAANDPAVSEETRNILTKDATEVDDAIDKVYETAKKPSEAEVKKAKEAETQDATDEVDFLNSLNAEVGLDADQAARLAELEQKIPKPREKEAVDSDIAAVEKEIEANKNKWFAADQNDKKAYVDYRVKNDALTKKLDELKSETNGQSEKISSVYSASKLEEREKSIQTDAQTTSAAVESKANNKSQTAPEDKGSSAGEKSVEPISKPTENVPTETVRPEKTEPGPKETGINQEEPAEKAKPAKPVNELVEEEEPDVKDSPEAIQKLDDEITAMKAADKKVMDTKFQGMLERAFKMKSEGKISRPTYTAFKNRMKDVYQGKKNIDAEELKLRSTDMIGKVKEKLLGQGYKNMALSTGMPITPKTVADMLDLTNAIIHKIIDAGAGAVSLAQATKKALEIVKKHPTYKKLVASKELDESVFESELSKMKEPAKKQPSREGDIHGETRKKKTAERLDQSTAFKDIVAEMPQDEKFYHSISAKKAKEHIDKVLDEVQLNNELESLAQSIIAGDNPFHPKIANLAAAMLGDRLRITAEQEGNEMQKSIINKLAADLFVHRNKNVNIAATQTAMEAEVAKMLPLSKEGLTEFAAASMESVQDTHFTEKQKKDVEMAQKELANIYASEEFKNKVQKAVDEELSKLAESTMGKEWNSNVDSVMDGLEIDLKKC
jgi:hypothetical protein